MIFRSEFKDLFSVPHDYTLCHCISADIAMGAGIAVKFSAMGIKEDLKIQCKANPKLNFWNGHGFALWSNPNKFAWNGCFNLVTKEKYWHKPTLRTMKEALQDMRSNLIRLNIGKIAMPMIGCGLDRLDWKSVSEIIYNVFDDTDLEIMVCIK